jgi:hypothetical protein
MIMSISTQKLDFFLVAQYKIQVAFSFYFLTGQNKALHEAMN